MSATGTTSIIIASGSFGGPATYSKLLGERLPSYGYEIKVVSFGDVLKYPKIIRHFIYFFKVLYHGFGAEIIYAQDPVSVGLPALLASKMLFKRFFLKIVGDYAWEQGSQRSGVSKLLDEFSTGYEEYSFLVRWFKKIQTFVANGAEKIIVPSNYLKRIVGNWGVDTSKISVVYNAFNEPKIAEEKTMLRETLNFKGHTIVSAGRLVPWKGFPTLIEAFAQIKNKYDDAELFIIDDGPDKEFLKNKVSELKLESSIKFLGRMPQQDLYKYIKAADIFALVSSYEGFSHLLIETLSIGTPIVTTPVGGNVEVIKEGENGLLVPFGDSDKTFEAIDRILSDKSLGEQLSLNGMKSVVKFTEDEMLKNLTAILK
ncbi:MAG: glycosyltransferase family 4 protein [Candidatus Paceibacterota bacterium]|jgi:glycosyltransferase involved in cell wall biosynthesis